MYRKKNAKRWLALLLAGTMVLSLAACGKKGDDAVDTPVDAGTSQAGQTEAPDGFVDNAVEWEDYDVSQIAFADEDTDVRIGVADAQAYYNGTGVNARFAANLLYSGTDPGADNTGIPLCWFWDKIGGIQLGDRLFRAGDLIRSRDQGYAVLKLLAGEYGVDKYDAETGEYAGYLGKDLEGDALREAYSERMDGEDYTVCVYYIHAGMSGMDDGLHAQCQEALEAEGLKYSQNLDGMLAVMLYYATDGTDLYYNIAVSAPTYYDSLENFKANMDSHVRQDMTKCHMLVDGTAVGFLNQVFILCDQDEVPEHTILPDAQGPESEGRVEDGGIADQDNLEELPDEDGTGTESGTESVAPDSNG